MTAITTVPLTIIADDREVQPYTFDGLGNVHVVLKRLITGDYSIPFHEEEVGVSRKSLVDLYNTLLAPDREERFRAELDRMQHMVTACVVVEEEYLTAPQPAPRSRAARVIVRQRIESYRRAFPRVQWFAACGRRGAEILTYAHLLAARERLECDVRARLDHQDARAY